MKFSRRQILRLAGGAALLPAVSPVARAQAYPSRPVRIIVGFPAGGSTDIYARLIGQWLSERFGAPFVVENRPGAGSNLGAEAVVKAPPDGYTLLLATGNNAVSATLFDKLNFDFVRDIAPVASIARSPAVLVVNPAVPATTVPELIAYAKSDPGKLNMGSGGNGSVQHVYGELFKMMTGVSMLHVPYRGTAPALADLVGGQVQVMFDTLSTSLEFIKAGKLRALAVTTAGRLEVLPDVPTVGDFVPGYEASGWLGLGAPKGTSIEIVDRLSKEVSACLTDPKLRARVADLGGTVLTLSPTEFRKFIGEEIEKWGKVVKFAGIKAE
jgi:tripartite-type tricarboxylate transporter receptor subunit TctC